jgi:myo-inositol 2-dehydrogenase/D-chiro-inositol 1-dehydrogenase
MVQKLSVAVSGLGRMGARHALHFVGKTPRANLVAACDPSPKCRQWAENNLALYGVRIYSDFDEMLRAEQIDAVVIATVTTVHAEQTIKAIQMDKHVLCEKPLSTSVEISQQVLDAARQKPHLKVLCGFSRRFDASYRDVAACVGNGDIGRASIIRSQTCDKLDPSGFFVDYAQFSGGIFVDCNVHDIDLTLWYFGHDSVVKSVSAVGVTAVQPGLKKWGDVDNGVGVVEFWGGKIAYFYGSRMMAAGQHDMTEVIGTEGKLVVNGVPTRNLVEVHEPSGVRREIPSDYFGRFSEAFVTEANEFTACCLDDKPLPFELEGAVQAVKIGSALQESLRSGKKIEFDEAGNVKGASGGFERARL